MVKFNGLSKELILVRHAKSSWDYEASDKDRPLKERGIRDAHLVSRHLEGKLDKTAIVFSSPANRALHTCMIFLRNCNIPLTKLTVTDELYDFGGDRVIKFLNSLDDDYKSVMIFGHNHAFTSIVNTFGNTYIDNVPTSGVVVIKFDTDKWKVISKGETKLVTFPKHLK
ncbi:histidine phosphatase family protein [Flavobacteriaceae bacterium R38]|nr:histidine phosphatase family protein [Flavobacteriaceae bacterium R38]